VPRLLILTEGPADGAGCPSTFYRVTQFLEPLRQLGWQIDVRPSDPPKYASSPIRTLRARVNWTVGRIRNRSQDLQAAEQADVVWLQRDLTTMRSARLEQLLRLMCRRLVFDFDDALYLNRGRKRKIGRICQFADTVLAGNATLAAFATKHNSATHVLPTVVDTAVYQPAPPTENARPVVGWIGLASNLPYLEPIARSLIDSGIELRIMTDDPGRLTFEAEVVPWSREAELDEVQRWDIGLMPLPDEPFARGKCGLKALLALACGKPVVLSPVGVNAEIVRDGVEGLHATTPDEWASALRSLTGDEALRARMGAAARERVVAHYSVEAWAPRLDRLLRG